MENRRVIKKNSLFYKRLLGVMVWLCEQVQNSYSVPTWTGVFKQVRINGIIVKGDIKYMKMNSGQAVDLEVGDFRDRHGVPATIQEGSGKWNFQSDDPNDTTVHFIMTPGIVETQAEARHISNQEVLGKFVFTADGDPDENEEGFINVTLDVTVDRENAVSGTMTASEPHD